MKRVTIADVCTSIVDGPFGSNMKTSDYKDFGVPVLQGKNITGDKFVWKEIRYLSDAKAAELARSSAVVGDHIVIKIGSIGYSAILDDLHGHDFAIIPANLARLRPDRAKVDDRYLHHWLKSAEMKRYFRSVASSTAQPALSLGKIRDAEIPLPPLDDQKRIAAILDQADALRSLRTRALDSLTALGQAIFHEMFGDREYPKRMLKDVGRVTTGGTPPTAEDRYYGSDVPFMTPGDLNSGTAAKRYLSRSGAEVVRTVDAGAALVCCIGATIGKMDMARATVAFNQQVNAVTWGSEVAPSYGLFALGIVRPEIERQGRGASTTLPILKKSSFEKIEIVLPPFDKQLSFSAKIDLLEGQTSMTRNEIFTLDALFTSLQHRAFRGEL